jgi:hypothetical protein
MTNVVIYIDYVVLGGQLNQRGYGGPCIQLGYGKPWKRIIWNNVNQNQNLPK